MKTLVAVVTCEARTFQSDAQRSTWAKGRDDVIFFIGGDGFAYRSDQQVLAVDDSYRGLPEKVKAVARWARSHDYEAVLKLDDDVYLQPDRFYRALPEYERYDYVGNIRMRNGNYPADYASGFCYWLGPRALEVIANAPLTDDTMEDRWVGNTLASQRPLMRILDEKRFTCTYPCGIDEPAKLWGSELGKVVIAVAQYPAAKFEGLHYWYRRIYEP